MPLCRFHVGRQCYCDRALVKLRRGANSPMTIATQRGEWELSPLALRENWPALLSDFRQSGNRRLDPFTRFGPTFQTTRDFVVDPWTWEYLASRLAHLEQQSRYGYQPSVRGTDPDNPLYYIFEEMKEALRNGDLFFYLHLEDALNLFPRICKYLSSTDYQGKGFGQGMYMEVLEMARLFAPIISEFDPQGMYELLVSLDEMTRGDIRTLRSVTDQIAPQYQQEILYLAAVDASVRGSLAGIRIYQVLS